MAGREVDPTVFHVEIDGQYGVTDGAIRLMDGAEELVMWDSQEWVEDPSLVYVIANAIVAGFTSGAEAVRSPGSGDSPRVLRTKSGRWVTEDDIERWAAAEEAAQRGMRYVENSAREEGRDA